MKTLELIQGSPEWLAHRATHYNASEAPAMMGCSPHLSRRALVRQLATGQEREFSDYVQERILAKGHTFEKLARPLAEAVIGEELFPATGECDEDARYSASFDGLTMFESIGWEHKSLNADLRAAMMEGCTDVALPLHYQVQMEHQCMVCPSIERVLFTASEWANDGELIEARHCWYTPNPELRAQIIAGWDMLAADVAAYQPEPEAPKPIGQAIDMVPALSIRVTGGITSSNLSEFAGAAMAVIDNFNKELATDQDFADAEKRIKWCADVEGKIKAAIEGILGDNASVDEAVRTLRAISDAARDQRLYFTKAVGTEKDARRGKVVQAAEQRLAAHVAGLNAALAGAEAGQYNAPPIRGELQAAIKGMKSLDSMDGALSAVVAKAIAQADALTGNLLTNRERLRSEAGMFLFPDFAAVGQKPPEDFDALLTVRQMRHHEAAEAAAKRDLARAAATQVSSPEPSSIAPPPQAIEGGSAGTSINLGQLNAMLAPVTVNAAGLQSLGFALGKDKGATLVALRDVPAICNALMTRIAAARDHATAKKAA